jgi:hypothetical protein
MARHEKLYGLPGDEFLDSTPEAVVDRLIDRVLAGDHGVIEEWSVRPAHEHFPSVSLLLDWLVEWTNENGEWSDDLGQDEFVGEPEVVAAADRLLDACARHLTASMADELLRTIPVEHRDGGWYLDGVRVRTDPPPPPPRPVVKREVHFYGPVGEGL